jgi:hypothetical protein
MTKNHVLVINPSLLPDPEVVLVGKSFVIRKKLSSPQHFSETLLDSIVQLLKAKRLEFKDLDGIAVILGKGSSTATRTAVAVANVLHFSLKIPLFAGKFDKFPPDERFFLTTSYKNGLIKPFYEYSARITPANPKKLKKLGKKLFGGQRHK